jgi:transposase
MYATKRCSGRRTKLHTKSVIKQLLRINKITIENAYFEAVDTEEIFIVKVRQFARDTCRCPHCGKRCPGYDSSGKLRRWRSLDFGSTRVYIEAFAPRIKCPEHGVVVARFSWAKHDSDYTYDFETAVTWMTLHATASDVSEYFRIKWHTVGSIAQRVQKRIEGVQPNRFDDLEKIGIDETSYKKGHKYMTVIVNHKTGDLIWAHKGHGKEILAKFFEELSEEQRATIKIVTADGARWISDCIKSYCPNAERCIDPFHVVGWANEQLDEIRKQAVRKAKKEAEEKPNTRPAKKKRIRRSPNMPC